MGLYETVSGAMEFSIKKHFKGFEVCIFFMQAEFYFFSLINVSKVKTKEKRDSTVAFYSSR
jgi:hypothetical protein